MFWLYVLGGTAGFVALVPAILRAVDQLPSNVVTSSIGCGLTTFGVAGLLLERFSLGWVTVLICSLALGGAVAAISPEVLKSLSNKPASAGPS